ncbi:DUF1003 domain-containing protein [Candidatus Clostridium radicumherbarum]|uniref:DUF1003 domain-containing protein n=1 Tax=Candidatus Clostridium radicumherbarum TaxID=3381662 RepID=A0ABW8TSW5_9CLOT
MENSNQYAYDNKEDLVKKILDNDTDLAHCQIDEELIHELLSGKISKNINNIHDENLSLGQRTADKIATFGGSWTFIISFGVVLFLWIVINTIILFSHPFDPYPFVFLNLVLSCLAAIQAPIIMMSQNRQSEKDRLTANNDYLVNLKSELIIEDLHYKIDEVMEAKTEIASLKEEIKELKAANSEILSLLKNK